MLSKRYLISLATLLVLISAADSASGAFPLSSSDDPSVSQFGLSLGYMTGMTLYHISSYDATGGVESELEFPLNTFLVGVEGSYRSKERGASGGFQFDYRLATGLGSGSGRMKDSDWLTGAPETDPPALGGLGYPAHPGLDIYSESDADLKTIIIDLCLSYDAWATEQWHVGPFAGFLYEKLSFDVSNVDQVGYGPYAVYFTGSMSGLVLTYEVTYMIPHVGIRTTFETTNAFEVRLDLGYSPRATAEDKDDHLLRGKISDGGTDGSAYVATLTADWEIQRTDHIQIRGQYLKIDTTGAQTQRWYRDEITSSGTIPAGTTITGIDDRIESVQMTILIAYQIRF